MNTLNEFIGVSFLLSVAIFSLTNRKQNDMPTEHFTLKPYVHILKIKSQIKDIKI